MSGKPAIPRTLPPTLLLTILSEIASIKAPMIDRFRHTNVPSVSRSYTQPCATITPTNPSTENNAHFLKMIKIEHTTIN
ncbi:hypothetical protein PGTUg99_030734 [Puccinia graminis f. sp. tritici]|uniref:Uncharacterized protein n=1 Tax=Puccinia graminis f. sp. tritici TaxID=56615 RepID=A0A5B0NKT0_PUCGR|nr:hypothetical protein PGTUg99_030734 [Puccinia graminis f. sp. tritici]